MKKAVLKTLDDRKRVSEEKNAEYIKTLKRMIDCKTVWTYDNENASEYEKFYRVLEEEFPNIVKNAEKLTFGGGCFVYVIKGKNAKKNIMLMSHHDVVEGSDKWNTDPFCAVEKDGYLYGRGTIDTKTPLFAELKAADELLSEGYDFEGINLYIGSSNNEEVCGDGMVLATEYFKKNNIHFEAVLDEGGAVTEGQIPGVEFKSAMVAVHEKSRHMYKCKTELDSKGHGGFGGVTDNAALRLSRFITEISDNADKIYKAHFYPEVKATFERHVPYISFPLSLVFGHFTLFSPLLKKIMSGIPAARAMLKTDLIFTTLKAGSELDPQIRAKTAEAHMFLRCVREDDLFEGLEKIKKIADKYGVKIEEVERDYCKPTDFNKKPFEVVEKVLHEDFPDVAVAPFLLTAGTDARRFTDVADSILRFAPIDLNKAQFATIHAENEHIGIKNVGECVVFYKDFIKEISK